MPKQSERAKLMRELEERLAIEGYHLTTRQLTGQVSTVDDDYFDALRYLYAAVESTRYLSERNYISRPLQYENVMSQTNDRDFKEWYRLTKSQFGRLLAAIQDHSAFQSKGVNQQTHPGNQLLVTLVRIPFFGTGASYSCTRMKVNTCIGSIRNYEKRVVKAILAMRDATICWPDERERQEIAFRIQLQYGFPNCVGFTDGCLFNLAEKPLSFGEDYFHRKSGFLS
ncbi:hypothetical protein BJ741DRAFT_436985 [Chytriomyces cf. hyalinus JEL632]|nr:hypothetical protein BJ741DRAFT_436985 [Chytriomyces cf. hyalinus JEL632]